MKSNRRWLGSAGVGLIFGALASCGPFPEPDPIPAPSGLRTAYSETPLCVVDRAATRGLRTVTAYQAPGGQLFLREGTRYRPLRAQYSETREGGYAEKEEWFRRDEPIRQYGQRYLKHGPNRVIPTAALTLGAPHQGIPVFLNRNDVERPAVLYVPVRPGCVFQPYVADRFRRAPGG